MMYCNNCGQSKYISDEYFIEYVDTSGWEKDSVDCEYNDYMECIDSEITDSTHLNYECANCGSEDINGDWEGIEEESFNKRQEYEDRESRRAEETAIRNKKEILSRKAIDPKRKWDIKENV